uniref:Uncharacterized protein n=1 Tax=Sciurus vulgaris TaxID=55149 RepID=A0A8D2CUD0_SCIVU
MWCNNLQNSTKPRCYEATSHGLTKEGNFFKIWPLTDSGFACDSLNGHRFSDD